MVYAMGLAVHSEALAYLLATLMFLAICAFEQMGLVRVFRGFLRLALLIILPSVAFPLADIGYLPFPQVTLYLAAFVMLAALPIFWW